VTGRFIRRIRSQEPLLTRKVLADAEKGAMDFFKILSVCFGEQQTGRVRDSNLRAK
jgi:hypothetical protein